MRKKEKEIKGREALEGILRSARVCRLAMCVDDEPYVVPLKAFDVIMAHCGTKAPYAYKEKGLEKACIIKVTIESMTGKQSGY